MERIENRTFDEIKLGDMLTYKDMEVFAIMSGDINPAHVDETLAKSDFFQAHGMWGAVLISCRWPCRYPGGTDLEAGNMLAKQLEYLAEIQMPGIVLGARVPITLTSRAAKTLARLGSCAIALLLARHKTERRHE